MIPLLKLTALAYNHNQPFLGEATKKGIEYYILCIVSFVISSPSFLSNGLTILTFVGFMFAFMFLRGFDSGTDLWGVCII